MPRFVFFLINMLLLAGWAVFLITVFQLHFFSAPPGDEEPLRHPPAKVVEPVYPYQFADKPRTRPPFV